MDDELPTATADITLLAIFICIFGELGSGFDPVRCYEVMFSKGGC